jgi:hypothetical protein
MAETPKSTLEFLEQLRKERDELDVLIAGLEKRLGIVSESAADAAGLSSASPRITVSVDSIPVGFFHNLSQADAAEKLLKLNQGYALKTAEILTAFRKSGMNLNPKNSLPILYTTLKRSPKFQRVAGQAWGLTEWYPEKRKRKEPEGMETEG